MFDRQGRAVTWCLGNFSVADGRYLGAARFDLDPPRVNLADGREIVARETAPGHWQVAERLAHGRHFVLLASSLTDLRSVALSVRGESAVVTRADGRRAVVALPGGRTVLPLAADGREVRSAVSPSGGVLALAGPTSVVVYDVTGSAPRRVAVLAEHRASLAFADDGHTLLVARGDGTLLSAWRENARDAPAPAHPVQFAVGNGVTSAEAPDGWLPRLDASRVAPVAPRVEHGLVAAFRRLYGTHAGVSDARVYATDAGEFAGYAGRTSGWGRAVMERYGDGGYDPTTLRVWQTGTAHPERAVEWRTRRTSTEGPWWTTVRAQELGGTLYRVEVDGMDGTAHGHGRRQAEADALLDDMITTPFGSAPVGTAPAPGRPRGGM